MEEFIKDLTEIIKKHGFDHDLGMPAENIATGMAMGLSEASKVTLD